MLENMSIQKKMNYVSRTTRDIMFGGNYQKDTSQLKASIENIREEFNSLKTIVPDDSVSSALIKDAKSSTMIFLEK